MDGVCVHEAISASQDRRKPKREHKIVKALSFGINSLPDEILSVILSFMSLKDAARTSVLSRRWRYLWMFTSGSLDFDALDNSTGIAMKTTKFRAWVNRVLKFHHGPRLDTFIVRFNCPKARADEIDRWIHFAIQKEVKVFELTLAVNRWWSSDYEFPTVKFGSLTSLRLDCVNIKDEMVHYLLASCPYLEFLSIAGSQTTKNLQLVDPIPNLKSFEIEGCHELESLHISAVNLVSLLYGPGSVCTYSIENAQNFSELTLIGLICEEFIYEPNKHSCYSVRLLKLELQLHLTYCERGIPHDLPQLYCLKRLELFTVSQVGRSLLFFTLLIKASPRLCKFRIQIKYLLDTIDDEARWYIPFPEVTAAEATIFYHNNLKLVEVACYIGCSSEENFVLHLLKIAPSLEKVVIDTQSQHFEKEEPLQYPENLPETGATTREEAKQHAKSMESNFPPKTQLVIK